MEVDRDLGSSQYSSVVPIELCHANHSVLYNGSTGTPWVYSVAFNAHVEMALQPGCMQHLKGPWPQTTHLRNYYSSMQCAERSMLSKMSRARLKHFVPVAGVARTGAGVRNSHARGGQCHGEERSPDQLNRGSGGVRCRAARRSVKLHSLHQNHNSAQYTSLVPVSPV